MMKASKYISQVTNLTFVGVETSKVVPVANSIITEQVDNLFRTELDQNRTVGGRKDTHVHLDKEFIHTTDHIDG